MRKSIVFIVLVSLFHLGTHASDEVTISSVQYWIDDNHADASFVPSLEFDVDCSALSQGMHLLHYRVCDSEGNYSSLQEHGFFKVIAVPNATKIESLQYWWDDMYQNSVTSPYSAEEFTLSTDALPYGLHSLKFRVKDDAGRWSGLQTHFFYKGETLEPSRIVSYSYWWNDLYDEVVTETLATPVEVFELDGDFTIPNSARTNFSGHYHATLNLIVTDSRGSSAFVSANVEYPDNDAPSTDIDADVYVTDATAKLTWTEQSGDAMGDYNVYYSKNDGPFILWLPDTKLTSATFRGEKGCVYLFTVTGRDQFGNREAFDETKCVSVTFE